jgi:hypothetical protein
VKVLKIFVSIEIWKLIILFVVEKVIFLFYLKKAFFLLCFFLFGEKIIYVVFEALCFSFVNS